MIDIETLKYLLVKFPSTTYSVYKDESVEYFKQLSTSELNRYVVQIVFIHGKLHPIFKFFSNRIVHINGVYCIDSEVFVPERVKTPKHEVFVFLTEFGPKNVNIEDLEEYCSVFKSHIKSRQKRYRAKLAISEKPLVTYGTFWITDLFIKYGGND